MVGVLPSVRNSYFNTCISNFTERKSAPIFVFLVISTNKNYHGIEKNRRNFLVYFKFFLQAIDAR